MFELSLTIATITLSVVIFFWVDRKCRKWAESRRAQAIDFYSMVIMTSCNSLTPSKVVTFCERKLPKVYGLSNVESAVMLRCEKIRADIEVKFRVHLNMFGCVVGVDYQVASIDINNRMRVHAAYEIMPRYMIQEV